jgi:hypothetical protein
MASEGCDLADSFKVLLWRVFLRLVIFIKIFGAILQGCD